MLYQVIQSFEHMIQLNLSQTMNHNINKILTCILEKMLRDSSGNMALLACYSRMLLLPIADQQDAGGDGEDALSHNCQDIKTLSFLNDMQKDQHQCSCRIIEVLIRYSQFYSQEASQALASVVQLFFADAEF